MNTYYLEYYGKELLKFGGDDVQPNYGFVLVKCKDTQMIVEGKCKNIMLEGCQNVKVLAESILSTIEVLNCKKVTIQVKQQLPQISFERSEGLNLYIDQGGKNLKIHSTCSQAMVIHYPKENGTEDDEWLDAPVPETFVSVLKKDQLVSEPLEGLE